MQGRRLSLREYQRLRALSAPVPVDGSRGHELHLAELRPVDGGVVVTHWQAFCRCGWSQAVEVAARGDALGAYERHLGGGG